MLPQQQAQLTVLPLSLPLPIPLPPSPSPPLSPSSTSFLCPSALSLLPVGTDSCSVSSRSPHCSLSLHSLDVLSAAVACLSKSSLSSSSIVSAFVVIVILSVNVFVITLFLDFRPPQWSFPSHHHCLSTPWNELSSMETTSSAVRAIAVRPRDRQ